MPEFVVACNQQAVLPTSRVPCVYVAEFLVGVRDFLYFPCTIATIKHDTLSVPRHCHSKFFLHCHDGLTGFSTPSLTFCKPAGLFAPVLPVILPINLLTGSTAILANHGVSHTHPISRTGKSILTTAHAVPTSTKTFIPSCPTFHLFPSTPPPASGSTVSPNHPFRLKYRPNFSMPSVTNAELVRKDGSWSEV
jgi:hypothetical protein